MNKIGTYALYGGALIFAGALVYASISSGKKTESANSKVSTQVSTQTKSSQKTEPQEIKPAEKVQIYEFHSTNRCYSCITMGEYIKAMVEESFQAEIKSGKLEFREINVDLPENKAIAAKFKAAGTSLFINSIIDGKDNIQEESQAWRLLGDQRALSDYLSKKIRGMIGETVSAQSQKDIEEMNITFYFGNECPDCVIVQEYLKENDVKNKIAFKEKNIDKNEIDAQQMAEDAMQCDVNPEAFSVPFLWADGKCYTNEKDIIDFFKQKLS